MRAFCARLLPVLVGVAAAGAGGCGKSLVDAPLVWYDDLDAATARATAENKPLLVYFGASWDCAAKELETSTFRDGDVRWLLARHFVALRVDASDDEDPRTRRLSDRFKVVGDPTVIVVGPDGNDERVRFNEFVAPRLFERVLRASLAPDGGATARHTLEDYWSKERARWARASHEP